MTASTRNTSLRIFSLFLLILLIPSFLAWMVNLELALQIFVPGLNILERLLPSFVYDPLAYFASDLSTISTLVPLLLLGFPFVMSRKVLAFTDRVDDQLRHLVYDPYPPHFPFFLVMLGLAGTLYGLLIGLDVSGVEKLGTEMASPESIQATLDRLLAGTATALLSSLLGLAGAFLAARPFTWLFHRAVGMRQEEESGGLTDALHHLIQDLQSLGDASQRFGKQLSHTELEAIPTTLRAIHEVLQTLGAGLTDANQKIQSLGDAQAASQAQLAPLTHLENLTRLSSLEELLGDIKSSQEQSNVGQQEFISVIRQSLELQTQIAQKTSEELTGLRSELKNVEALLRDVEGQGRQTQSHLGEIVGTLENVSTQAKAAGQQAKEDAGRVLELLNTEQVRRQSDRSTLQKAAGLFLDGALSQTHTPDPDA